MNTWEKHSILLWKTARESWLFVLVMAVLPVVNRHPHFTSGLPHPEYLILFPLIGIWGALKSSAANSPDELDRTHLPVSKGLMWFYSCLLPTFVALALGAWAGHWLRESLPYPGSAADRPQIMEGRGYLGLIYGVAFAASYSLAYALTAATSKWIGIVISSLWLFTVDFVWIYGRPEAMEAISIYGAICVGCTVASLMYLALEGKRSARFRQALALTLVALSFTQPVAGLVRRSLAERVTPSVTFPDGRFAYRSMDGSITVQRLPGQGRLLPRHATSLVEYVNYRAGLRRRQTIRDSWAVLGTVSDRTAYLAQADPGGNMVHIVEWDIQGNKLRQIAAIPARAEPWVLSHMRQASTDPHGRYIAFVLYSVIGEDVPNLWLLDLRSKTPYLVAASVYCSPDRAVWLRDRVLIPGDRENILVVDLGAKRAHDIPLPREVN